MPLGLDPNFIAQLGSLGPLGIAWLLFIRGGWIILAVVTIKLWWDVRLLRLQSKFLSQIEYVLLAIDIPKDSEQTPKAMEQVFATITGAHAEISERDKYFTGEVQLPFSWEVISIDGHVQFLVRSPKVYRDLTEGAIYAQYPNAEITEVDDYTKDIPNQYPNDKYNIWGAELQLVKNEAYPIRTYTSFEDKLSQELKDPIASLVENMSRIQRGEQVWLQIITVPTENIEWVNRVLKVAYKVAGKTKQAEASSKNWYGPVLNFLYTLPDWFTGAVTPTASRREQFDFRVLNLTPGERAAVEAIENKASKLGFVCKIRLVYVAPHETYQTGRVVNSVFGAIKQFNDLTLNALKPNKRTKTSVVWFFIEGRKNARRQRIIRNYKARSWWMGAKYFILNVEELATLYHFPSILITSPLLKRTEVKKSDAPVQLPIEAIDITRNYEEQLRKQLVNLELDNDYYEKKYAKYRTSTGEPISVTPPKAQSKAQQSSVPENLPIQQ